MSGERGYSILSNAEHNTFNGDLKNNYMTKDICYTNDQEDTHKYLSWTSYIIIDLFPDLVFWQETMKYSSIIRNILYASLREEPIQIYVILQQKLPASKLSAVCAVYKQ